MITKFKMFETKFVRTPVRNDWIIDKYNNIAKIVLYDKFYKTYQMKCFHDDYYPRYITRDSIIHFGTKDEMELIMAKNKYNL